MITKAEIRQAAIAAGIRADDVDKLLGPGLALPSADVRLTLRLVVDDGDTFLDPDNLDPDNLDQPKRLGTLGCRDKYCDGPAGHTGSHFQWVPE